MLHGAGRRARRAAPLVALAALLGCGGRAPAEGMLPARWTDPQGGSQPVPFSFEAENAKTGRMFTTLGKGGEFFQGTYVRVEAATEGHLVTEVYNGWSSPEWEVWQHDPDGNWSATAVSFGDFAHFYTGKVVATLRGSAQHAMRCRFTLADPAGGLLEGGRGECQISDGGRVALEF